METNLNEKQLAYLKSLESPKKRRKFLLDCLVENLIGEELFKNKPLDFDEIMLKNHWKLKRGNGNISYIKKWKPIDFDIPKDFVEDFKNQELFKGCYNIYDLKKAFNESRLTNPTTGFKYSNFKDYTDQLEHKKNYRK